MNNRKTLFLILLLTLSLSACTPIASTVDEPCDWCGAKATKHYNSAIGSVVFVCNDCYEEIEEFNS